MSGLTITRTLLDNDLARETMGYTMPATAGEVFGAAIDMPTLGGLAGRQIAIDEAQAGPRTEFRTAREAYEARRQARDAGDQVPYRRRPDDEAFVAPGTLNEEYRALGLKFDRPTTREAARLIAEGRQAQMIRDDTVARGRGAMGVGAALAGGLIASATDPLEAGLALLPVPGLQAWMVGRFGAVAGRVGAGVVEGAIGGAITEPFMFGLSRSQQLDYTLTDALFSVGFGAALGGAVGGVAGAVARRAERRAALLQSTLIADANRAADLDVPGARLTDAEAAAADDMLGAIIGAGRSAVDAEPPEVRAAAFRAALAQAAEGKPANVEGIVSIGPKVRRPQSLLEWVADTGGLNDADPTFRGEIEARGLGAVPFRGRIDNPASRRNLDDVAQAAAAEGFIADPDPRALMEAIDREARGERIFRAAEQAEADQWQARRDAIAQADRDLTDFDATVDDMRAEGYPEMQPEDVMRVVELRRQGMDLDAAVERASIEAEPDADVTGLARYGADTDAEYGADPAAVREVDEFLAREPEIAEDVAGLEAMVMEMRDAGALTGADVEVLANLAVVEQKAAAVRDVMPQLAACVLRTPA